MRHIWDSVFTLVNVLCKDLCKKILLLLMFIPLSVSVHAADTTENSSVMISPGLATLAGSPEIIVNASYSDDDNGNLWILIEWGEDGVDYSLGSHNTGFHPASPFTFPISPLDNSKTYQVRVTFQDVDNVSNPQIVMMGRKPFNPLVHNAVSTGSGTSKWASGWGIADPGAQYGEFGCQTCHDRMSGNIKRIRRDWSDGSLPGVPAKLNAETVVLQDVRDGTAQFAIDDSIDHVSSNRICEACHTLTDHHRYDESSLPDKTSDHSSTKDCTICHKHQNGFAAVGSCSSCHGGGMSGVTESNYWPDSSIENTDSLSSENNSGEHVVHMTRLAAIDGMTLQELLDDIDSGTRQIAYCDRCHPNPGSGSNHYKGDDVGEVGNFQQMDGAADAGTPGVFFAGAATCSNIDCHNGVPAASPSWYGGASSSCTMCHSVGASNGEAIVDPVSGLHYHATNPTGAVLHDDNFGGSGDCNSCHTTIPSDGHFNGIADTPDMATFNMQSSGNIDIKLNTLNDATDDTCAANCHSDSKNWYRLWSADAFDNTAFDELQPLPDRCGVCHGKYGYWTEGTSHAGTWQGSASTTGGSHNSQNPNIKPGAACEDCHVYPSRADLHENGSITLHDDTGSVVDPVEDVGNNRIYCMSCHTAANAGTPGNIDSEAFPISTAFPLERIAGTHLPIGSCFSGAAGCHGDTLNRWWPAADPEADGQAFERTDPTQRTVGLTNYGYPNRAGAHIDHNITIGELICETRTGSPCTSDPTDAIQNPTDTDYNNTCSFCHPMAADEYGVLSAVSHRDGTTDLFGGWKFPGANQAGTSLTGDPVAGAWTQYEANNDGNGYIYQLDDPDNPGSLYPLDEDGGYRQFLYDYRTDPALDHGTCTNIACHSNSPFTPNWYGDEQAPGQISDLAGSTHGAHATGSPDMPGTVILTWAAPGDNGDLDGTAYEYEVYYSTSGPITEANVGSATRAGNAPTVLRKGESQEMIVDGLTPGTDYYFAVRTKDQPYYVDTTGDGIKETFRRAANVSLLGSTGPVTAHPDDLMPTFWGINQAYSHDTGGSINISWESARDHTLPITYRIYYTTYALKTHLANGGVLPDPGVAAYSGGVDTFGFNEADPSIIVPAGTGDYDIMVTTTRGIECQIDGLDQGVLYNLLVRAEDGVGTPNVDDNTVVTMAMPSNLPQEDENTMLYLLSGASSMVVQADPTNPDWGTAMSGTTSLSGTGSVTWTATSDLDGAVSRDFWVQGISIDLHITNTDRRNPQSFDLQMGYDNGSFNAIGSAVSVGIGRRASRVMKISLSSNAGLVPADANLALRITRTSSVSTSDIDLGWGDNTNKGQALITAQPINHKPSTPVLNALSRGAGGYVDVTWSTSNDGGDGGQTVHYDVVASCDGGVNWCYIIGLDLDDTDATNGVTWDPVGNGLANGNYNCEIRVEASDGYLYENTPGSGSWESHVLSTPGAVSLNNMVDDEAPAAVTINHIEPRPKQGSTYLHWIAVGNDGYNHGTRAAYYDVRYRKVADGALNAASWNDVDTIQAEGEPVPEFSGTAEEFELLNMTPDTDYQIAIDTCDETGNCSGLSNVYTITSGQYYCGICHSTPPDEPDTRGIHRQHGYTLEDCANCHGDGTNPDGNDVTSYDGRHYDGVINIGWAKNSSGNRLALVSLAPTDSSNVTINQGVGIIYNDPDGAGGYNSNGSYTATANTDSGRCMNFIGANASGCHGPFTPKWAADTVEPSPTPPACADCHGDKTATRDTDPYGRIWDCNDGGAPSELVKASPPQANHGGTTTDDRYVGAHERHLNASFRFAKKDSCRLCHKDTMSLGLHADGNVDVLFDPVADQDNATTATVDQTHGTVDTVGASCGSLNNMYCHDTGANWAEPGAKCNSCHGMAAKTYDTAADITTIGHVMGAMGDVVECTYCHVAGHPQSPDGINPGDPDSLLVNNNAAIGINYRSGGIHLKRVYPWGTFTTLAEICWGCHDQNNDGDVNDAGDISEWGTNTSAATGSSNYNFGTLNQKQWAGAIWSSGYGQNVSDPFYYKRGTIQSTHTTDPTGTSQVVWDAANGRYNETADSLNKIRCSNCHDVHDSNLAPGDTMTGAPYLRGTWRSNPYEEDGAPYNKAYTSQNVMGAVPRGGTAYDELGGYYIDQNNVVPGTGNSTQTQARYPTSGWTVKSSAGLCILCHGDDIDSMDQRTPGVDAVEGNLWLGSNGHANAALGGSFAGAVDIFDSTHGRPTPVSYDWGGGRPKDRNHWPVQVADTAYLDQGESYLAGGGYRGQDSNSGTYMPMVTLAQPYAFNSYDWGATVGTGIDQMYHQFSCSKCHNPHASRLPKLMITNCLDLRHNTWDDARSSTQTSFTASALDPVDRNMPAAYYTSAQNCHRFDPARGDTDNDNAYENKDLRGGWNRVTPWVKENISDTEHKGSGDPAYGPGNSTSPWRHSDFPTEPTGW